MALNLDWLRKYMLVLRVRGVPVYVHWSVPALAIFILGVGVERILIVGAAVVAYLAMLAIHELGHQLVAQWRGYQVNRIELNPFHARCWLDHPEGQLDASLIASGGVVAQWLVALPFIGYRLVFGYTPYEPINAFIAILGFLSPGVAMFNLLPVAPLDGKKAWSFFPLLWRRWRFSHRSRQHEQTAAEIFQEIAEKRKRRK